jgi:hypothetical protein
MLKIALTRTAHYSKYSTVLLITAINCCGIISSWKSCNDKYCEAYTDNEYYSYSCHMSSFFVLETATGRAVTFTLYHITSPPSWPLYHLAQKAWPNIPKAYLSAARPSYQFKIRLTEGLALSESFLSTPNITDDNPLCKYEGS